MERHLSREMLEALVETQERIDKLDLIGMLEFLVKQIIKTLGVKRCAIFRVFTELETLRLVTGEPEGGHGLGMEFSFSSLEAFQEVVETKSFVSMEDAAHDPRTKNSREKIRDENINAILLIPVIVMREVQGIISVDATQDKGGFSSDEIQFCLILANLAGLLLERDLMLKQKANEESLVAIGKVAEEAVHRLRNPIHYIHGFAKRLLKETEDWPLIPWTVKDYTERILDGALELEKTVNGLIRFSRRKMVNVTKVDINQLIKNLSAQLTREDKNFRLSFSLDPNLPQLTADPIDIEEIISPILHNAKDAIQQQGEIRVKTKQENGFVKICISNNGGCIDEEILEDIFNPFFTTKPDATGLGLAAAVTSAVAYRGKIVVENDKDANVTTFMVNLPIK